MISFGDDDFLDVALVGKKYPTTANVSLVDLILFGEAGNGWSPSLFQVYKSSPLAIILLLKLDCGSVIPSSNLGL